MQRVENVGLEVKVNPKPHNPRWVEASRSLDPKFLNPKP